MDQDELPPSWQQRTEGFATRSGHERFWQRADQGTSARIIDHALDHGINFIDTANIYAGSESERIIGEALAGKRHNVVLATKAGLVSGQGPNERGSSRYHLRQELENSLKRLKPIMWTCIRFIRLIRILPSRKPYARWMIWYRRAGPIYRRFQLCRLGNYEGARDQ